MQIQTITNQSTPVSHRGGITALNKLNPIAVYADRYFARVADSSSARIEPLVPALAGKVNKIRFNNISAWDINPNNRREYILFLHGMSQCVSNYQSLYETILGKGKAVFALEYRGYGENEKGNSTEGNLHKDVSQAYNYLTKIKGIDSQDITIIGHSMGGALATHFASKHKDIKALVLISPLTKMSFLGNKFTSHKALGVGAPQSLIDITKRIKPLSWLYDLKFNSISKIPKIKTPIFYLQSDNDSVTTLSGAEAFVQKSREQGILRQFRRFPAGGHKVDSSKIKAIAEILDEIYT